MARSHREPGKFDRAVERFEQPVRTRVETRQLRATKRAQARKQRIKAGGAVVLTAAAVGIGHEALNANDAQQQFRIKQNGNTPERVQRQRRRNEATERFNKAQEGERSSTGQSGLLVEGQETIIDQGSKTELNGGTRNSTESPELPNKGGGVSSGSGD